MPGITKCDRELLQSAYITMCNRLYYKMRQVLQSVTVILKRNVTKSIYQQIQKRTDKTYRRNKSS